MIIIIIILSFVIAPFPYKHAQRRTGLRLWTVLAKHILTTKLLTHIGVVPVTITPVHGHSLLYAVHWPVSGLGIRTFKNEHVHQDHIPLTFIVRDKRANIHIESFSIELVCICPQIGC